MLLDRASEACEQARDAEPGFSFTGVSGGGRVDVTRRERKL